MKLIVYHTPRCPFCTALFKTFQNYGCNPLTDSRFDLRTKDHPDYVRDSSRFNYSTVPMMIAGDKLIGGYDKNVGRIIHLQPDNWLAEVLKK